MECVVYKELLSDFVEASKEIFKANLTGVYLHGSAAMGCFNTDKSDLDLILIVKADISDVEKTEFMECVVEFNEKAPSKGIELSIVKKEFCNPFVYPTPYELHFSVTHLNWFKTNPKDYIEKMRGTDKDLAAHFTIINRYGIVLYGEGISEVFGEVPKEDYIDSIWFDVENAKEDIVENPMYIILNLCRVLAYLQEGLILSKKTGGEWGIKMLPERFGELIESALQDYVSDNKMKDDIEMAAEFADYMIDRIGRYREK